MNVASPGIQSLVASLSSTTDIWVGGNDRAEQTNFAWANGDTWSYENWNTNQPNHNNNQDCVKIKKNIGRWDDVACTNTVIPYACQKDPS